MFHFTPVGNTFMGYTMKTDKYRYTEWVKFHPGPEFKPDWGVFFYIRGKNRFYDLS